MPRRCDAFCITGQIKNDSGYTVTIHCGVIAVDIEDAIRAFKSEHPDAKLWTISHRGGIEIITSDAIRAAGGGA
jgi:hypothetical protein